MLCKKLLLETIDPLLTWRLEDHNPDGFFSPVTGRLTLRPKRAVKGIENISTSPA